MIDASLESVVDNRWTLPVRADLALSLLDCSSRLLPTLRARCYDKIRREVGTVPHRIRAFSKSAGVAAPEVHLNILGLPSLASGFSAHEIQSLCAAIEEAGLSAGADRVRLGCLDVAGGARTGDEFSMIPDLLAGCDSSELILQLGSSSRGANARDLYATALMLLTDTFGAELAVRLILACNMPAQSAADTLYIDHLGISIAFSTWPLLASLRDELALDACYTDRLRVLRFVGEKTNGSGSNFLRSLIRDLNESGVSSTEGQVNLSINAPGEGPGPAGIWAGLPISASADASANRTAAIFLRSGLSAQRGFSCGSSVESDGLPLVSSVRNIKAVPSDTTPASLAGHLVGMFSAAVEYNLREGIRIVQDESGLSDQGVRLDGVSGTIPLITRDEGWTSNHFKSGGLILAPSIPAD